MDNYLSHRWPKDGGQPRRAPARPARRKRRLWRDLLVAGLALAVLAGFAVLGFFGARRVAELLTDWAGDPQPSWHEPEPSVRPGQTGGSWTPERLPQAEPDPSVQLELNALPGETLDARSIYEKVLPSVVLVQAEQRDGYSVGSGFFISASGYLVTNYHIIDGGLDLSVVQISDMSVYSAALVGYDEELDLAVLKALGGTFTPAELGDSDTLHVGDPVYAIGNPMGYLYGTMTDGIVSALTDRVSELDYPGRLILTSAPLNSGNSGGTLVDSMGRVVGISSAKVTGIRDEVVAEGLGLAIPLSDAAPYLDRILRTGRTARPSIGISCYTAAVDGYRGVLVKEVTEGTPAAERIRPDDLICGANGADTPTVDDLTRIFAALDPGDTVELTIRRHGRTLTVTVELYDRLSAE